MAEKDIIAAFDTAAQSYDAWTQVQRDVARALVDRAGGAPETILDLGAGTGHVTGFAREKWPRAKKFAALDAAPNMLARLKQKYPDVETIHADAAAFAGAARYDLIVSSMALHWLPEPAAVLENWRRMLAPRGAMHVAAPVEGTVREWRDLLRAAGLEDSLWRFPPENFAGVCEIVEFPARFDSALAFARSLKKSGAHRGAPGARPLPAPALRRVLSVREGPFTATFKVAFLKVAAPAVPSPRMARR